jgi:hypothetical protein
MARTSEITQRHHLNPQDEATERIKINDASAISSAAASATLQATTAQTRFPAWITRLGSGIWLDIRARAPWYISDWTDAWNYRVVPATALIFFAK